MPTGASDGAQYVFHVPARGYGDHSFPGGHVATMATCATFLSYRFELGVVEPALVVLVTAMGIGRMADRGHWLSDQVVGVAFGYAIGKEVARRQKRRLRRETRPRDIQTPRATTGARHPSAPMRIDRFGCTPVLTPRTCEQEPGRECGCASSTRSPAMPGCTIVRLAGNGYLALHSRTHLGRKMFRLHAYGGAGSAFASLLHAHDGPEEFAADRLAAESADDDASALRDRLRVVRGVRRPSTKTLQARAIVRMLDAASAAGLNRDALVEAAGLRGVDLSDGDSRLSTSTQVALWQLIAKGVSDPGFGVRMGASAKIGNAGLLGYVMRYSATLEAALGRFVQYGRVLNDAVESTLERVDSQHVAIAQTHPEMGIGLPLAIDYRLSALFSACREITEVEIVPFEVTFGYEMRASTIEHARFFRCPLRFGHDVSQIVFEERDMRLPVRQSDEKLAEYLSEYAQQVLRSLVTGHSVSERVRSAIWNTLSDGRPTLPPHRLRAGDGSEDAPAASRPGRDIDPSRGRRDQKRDGDGADPRPNRLDRRGRLPARLPGAEHPVSLVQAMDRHDAAAVPQRADLSRRRRSPPKASRTDPPTARASPRRRMRRDWRSPP